MTQIMTIRDNFPLQMTQNSKFHVPPTRQKKPVDALANLLTVHFTPARTPAAGS